jgi:hypothetical protein
VLIHGKPSSPITRASAGGPGGTARVVPRQEAAGPSATRTSPRHHQHAQPRSRQVRALGIQVRPERHQASTRLASWRQSPFTRRLVLYQDTIARGHEVQPLTCVRAEVQPVASGVRGTIPDHHRARVRMEAAQRRPARGPVPQVRREDQRHRGHGPLSGFAKPRHWQTAACSTASRRPARLLTPERSAVIGKRTAAHISRIRKVAGVPDLNQTTQPRVRRLLACWRQPALIAERHPVLGPTSRTCRIFANYAGAIPHRVCAPDVPVLASSKATSHLIWGWLRRVKCCRVPVVAVFLLDSGDLPGWAVLSPAVRRVPCLKAGGGVVQPRQAGFPMK